MTNVVPVTPPRGVVADMATEMWALNSIAPDYEVSSLGRVRRAFDGHSTRRGRVKVLRTTPAGYVTVGVMIRRPVHHQTVLYVHRLVADGFLGSAPFAGAVACHINGIRDDNRPENLRWDTYAGNEADKVAHGTKMLGEAVHTAALTEAAVREIRALYGTVTVSALSRRYGVSRSTIRRAASGFCWGHVT